MKSLQKIRKDTVGMQNFSTTASTSGSSDGDSDRS